MKHTYNYKYNEILLRPLIDEDIEKMRCLRNSCRKAFIYSGEISQEEQVKWYQKYTEKNDDIMFSVIYNNQWIGTVALYDLHGESTEFGRLMLDSTVSKKKGLGVDVTRGACEFALRVLEKKRIYLTVYEDNVPAIKTYLRAGFFQTGETVDANRKKLLCMELSISTGTEKSS